MAAPEHRDNGPLPPPDGASAPSCAGEREGAASHDVPLPLKLQFDVTLPNELGGELKAWRRTFERFTDIMERWLESSLAQPGLPAPPAMPWTTPVVRRPEQPASLPPARVETLPPPPTKSIPTPARLAAPPPSILPEEMPVLVVEDTRPAQRETTTKTARMATVDLNETNAVRSKTTAPDKTVEVRSAAPTVESAETADPKNDSERKRAALFAQRGEHYRVAGQKEKALDCYRKALAIDAGCSQAYLGRASVYIEQGRLNEALLDCNSALQREPQRAVLYVLRGLVYTRLGNLKRALKEAEDAIRFNPQLPSAYMLRGSTRFKNGTVSEALADVKEAIRLRPNDAKFHAELGSMLAQAGQHEEAARTYRKVLELSPSFHEARFLRGAALRLAGEIAEAEAEFSEYLRRCPQAAAAHYQRGLCRLAQRNYAQAMTDFDKVLALKPDDQAARAAKEKTLNLWEGAAKDPKGNADTEAEVDLVVDEPETTPPPTAPGKPATKVAEPTVEEKEPPLTKEKRQAPRAAPKPGAAKRPARTKAKRQRSDEERSPWIRRVAVAAAVLALGYILGPMVWSFVMGRSFSPDDKDTPVAEAKVSAAELWERYQSDAASAQSTFGQRIIEVRGYVKDVRSPQKEAVQIVLMGDRKGGQIVCTLAATKSVTQGTLLSRVDRFGTVALIGKCMGQVDKTVNLDDVRLIEVRGR